MSVEQADRNRRIVELVRSGGTFSQIAAKFGMTRSAVAGVLYRSRKPRVMPGKPAPGEMVV